MLIECIGHSCFYLTTKSGIRILIDPYDNTIGLRPVKKEADIVLVTHDHYDHAYTKEIRGEYTLIDAPGSYELCGVKITGLSTYHDEEQGALRGTVTPYLIETEGIRILHMGDTGVMPEDSFFEAVGHVDVLMVPVGGVYTLDAQGALLLMERIEPNITIPMHYKINSLLMDIAGVHNFLTVAGREYDKAHLGECRFEITADSLKKRDRIIVMECCNAN